MSAPALPQGRFEGQEEFRDLVRGALAAAAAQGWREIVLCDPDFADWPLGERAVAESLHAWSASGRNCILLARRYDEVRSRHARFVQWRQRWTHIIDARGCRSAEEHEMPSAIWTPGWALQRLDLQRCTGFSGAEPERRLGLRETLDEWLRKSSPAFPAGTLGL